jgi:nitroreductase
MVQQIHVKRKETTSGGEMMLHELIEKNRSYRRFQQEVAVDLQTLRELVDLARLSASAGNMQPLRYVLSCDPRKNATVFPNLAWARYIENWPGPPEGERPSAYIIVLEDRQVDHPLHCDHGIAAQSILLGATERGLGGCIIGSVNKLNLRNVLNIRFATTSYWLLRSASLKRRWKSRSLALTDA